MNARYARVSPVSLPISDMKNPHPIQFRYPIFSTLIGFHLWACLDVRNYSEVRKWGSIIAHFPIYPNTGKGK